MVYTTRSSIQSSYFGAGLLNFFSYNKTTKISDDKLEQALEDFDQIPYELQGDFLNQIRKLTEFYKQKKKCLVLEQDEYEQLTQSNQEKTNDITIPIEEEPHEVQNRCYDNCPVCLNPAIVAKIGTNHATIQCNKCKQLHHKNIFCAGVRINYSATKSAVWTCKKCSQFSQEPETETTIQQVAETESSQIVNKSECLTCNGPFEEKRGKLSIECPDCKQMYHRSTVCAGEKFSSKSWKCNLCKPKKVNQTKIFTRSNAK